MRINRFFTRVLFTVVLAAFVLAAWPVVAMAEGADGLQDWKYPKVMRALPRTAGRLEAFVPAGWRIEQRVPGHLDADAVRDMVLVLRQTDPAKVLRGDLLPPGVEVNLNPRIILGLLKTSAGYRLVARNDRLIPAPESEFVFDPLDSVVIENRVLKLTISFFASMGTYHTSTSVFHFKLDDECLHLLRYEDDSFRRNAETMRRMQVEYRLRDDLDPRERNGHGKLKPVAGPCFEELGDAWEMKW